MKLSDYAEINGGEFNLAVRKDIAPKLFEDWIQLTAHREATRVERMAALANEIAKESPSTALRLARLHDHKGLLTVIWAEKPTDKDMSIVEEKWESVGNEPKENVSHYAPQIFKGDDIGDWDVSR